MTEKRFTYINASKNHYIGSFFYNDVPLTNKEVIDLLNEFNKLVNIANDLIFDIGSDKLQMEWAKHF